jgi:phosphoglycerate dehydrogenase-like enzyme
VGVDALPLDEFGKRGLLLTNGGDNFSQPMAEWVVLGILASAKRLTWFVHNSDNAKWDNSIELKELQGAKVLLLGMGSVNSLVAQMLKGFGAEIVGWSRTLRPQEEDGIRSITGEAWQSEITQADYVVVGLPMTKATRGIINQSVLESMKDDVTIVNLSRGGLIDHDALVKVLDRKKIRFVLLDAYEVEPLPSSDPLWRRENVLVLPHHSWSSPKVTENTVQRMRSLLATWVAGEPIEDAVDYGAGY